MTSTLLAIYVVAAWSVRGEPNAVRWHEFQLPQHFFSRNVCEHYKPKLVAKWIASSDTPFRWENVVSTRCGAWEPDSDEGVKM